MRLSSQSSSHINVVTSCLRQIVNWSVMFIFTMVQSHTHEDTVETVLHYMSSQATTAEVTQWKCLFHMWHLSEAIICVSNLETLWHQRVKHFCWILCDNSIRCKLSFYVSWKGVLINCDLSTFNLHVYVCFSVTWVCTCIHGSARAVARNLWAGVLERPLGVLARQPCKLHGRIAAIRTSTYVICDLLIRPSLNLMHTVFQAIMLNRL